MREFAVRIPALDGGQDEAHGIVHPAGSCSTEGNIWSLFLLLKCCLSSSLPILSHHFLCDSSGSTGLILLFLFRFS
ncbi:hypothetical protein VTN31DRAFT_1469 [Thermomyces dupontii]|uniref:uncharacterized protein n=1 Tax=Talaromyces thermophilus TaxID=28565 RepID=UPI003742F62C